MSKLDKIAEEYANKQKMKSYDTQMRRETFTRYGLKESYKMGVKETINLIDWDKIKIDWKDNSNFDEILISQMLNKLKEQIENQIKEL